MKHSNWSYFKTAIFFFDKNAKFNFMVIFKLKIPSNAAIFHACNYACLFNRLKSAGNQCCHSPAFLLARW